MLDQLSGLNSELTTGNEQRKVELDRIAKTIGLIDARQLRLFLRTPKFDQQLRIDLLRQITGDQPTTRANSGHVPARHRSPQANQTISGAQIEKLKVFMRQKVVRGEFSVSFRECAAHLQIRGARLNDWLRTFDDRTGRPGCIKTRGVRRLMIAARLEEAECLIHTSDLSVPEIALRVGYSGAKTLQFNYRRLTGRDLESCRRSMPRTTTIRNRKNVGALNDWSGAELKRRVTNWLRLHLWEMDAPCQALSEALAMPFRKISDRLRTEGTCFRSLQRALRLADAERRLRLAKGDLHKVAADVGYSEAYHLKMRMAQWANAHEPGPRNPKPHAAL